MKTFSIQTLNPPQQKAVEYFDSPLLIVAGAGSGKTMVIVHKILYLIRQQIVNPENILAITFTNKTAREMRDRVGCALPPQSSSPYISTFHAFCGDVLRTHFHLLGQSNHYVIFDSSDQLRLLTQIIKTLQLDEKKYSPQWVSSVLQILKMKLISAQKYAQSTDSDRFDPIVAQVYQRYQQHLVQNQAVDFSDMIFWTVKLFVSHPDILKQYHQRFRYILVDEYQDTNYAQYYLIKCLTGDRPVLTVVGDFDQNIYSWRGANMRNILNFEKDFPGAKIVLLEQNYRSTQQILQAANGLIQHNVDRKKKNLWTQNPKGEKLHYFIGDGDREEARFVAEEILQLKKERNAFKDMVVLYRTNAQSRLFEETFMQQKIPYQVIGALKFFNRAEIKDIAAYLRLVNNPHDNLAFSRISNRPSRGIGATSLSHLINYSTEQAKSIAALAVLPELPVSTRCKNSLAAFFMMISDCQKLYRETHEFPLATVIQAIIERSGYLDMLKCDPDPKAKDKIENIMELISLVKEESLFLEELLDKIALASEQDEIKDSIDQVTLMTLHNAKGLEFDYVFMVGMEEGLLPHYRSLNNEDSISEERRLCYVGITRGKKKVYLTRSHTRLLFGDIKMNPKSRFIQEIPSETIHILQPQDVYAQPQPFQEKINVNYHAGQRVEHTLWGPGTIRSIKGTGPTAVLLVQFGQETRTLIAKYAPLQVVE